MRYIDITATIVDGMRRYPTDPEVDVRPFKSLANGNSCNLLSLSFGSHVATHIDAPRHLSDRGLGVDRIGLDRLICDVLVTSKRQFFKGNRNAKRISGVIFKGRSSDGELTIEEAKVVLKRKIGLVGTEGPTIEGPADRSHPVHRLLLENGVLIVEGLELEKVKSGYYRLICLPLKIKNGDGAPVRAVLVDG